MDGLLLLALIPVVALGLWAAISPRSQWRILVAWGYRDPEANEPSDAAYALTRIGSIVLLGILAWQVIAPTIDSGDTDVPPAATATSTADAAEQLRSAFGVTAATVVMLPLGTTPSTGTRPVKILRHKAVEASAPPAYVADALAGRAGAWLVLGVRADAPPTGVQVNEMFRGIVHVGVLAGCGSPCPTGAVESGDTLYLVPVELDKPLARRLVVDSVTGLPVP